MQLASGTAPGRGEHAGDRVDEGAAAQVRADLRRGTAAAGRRTAGPTQQQVAGEPRRRGDDRGGAGSQLAPTGTPGSPSTASASTTAPSTTPGGRRAPASRPRQRDDSQRRSRAASSSAAHQRAVQRLGVAHDVHERGGREGGRPDRPVGDRLAEPLAQDQAVKKQREHERAPRWRAAAAPRPAPSSGQEPAGQQRQQREEPERLVGQRGVAVRGDQVVPVGVPAEQPLGAQVAVVRVQQLGEAQGQQHHDPRRQPGQQHRPPRPARPGPQTAPVRRPTARPPRDPVGFGATSTGIMAAYEHCPRRTRRRPARPAALRAARLPAAGRRARRGRGRPRGAGPAALPQRPVAGRGAVGRDRPPAGAGAVRRAAPDGSPPLYYLLLHAWIGAVRQRRPGRPRPVDGVLAGRAAAGLAGRPPARRSRGRPRRRCCCWRSTRSPSGTPPRRGCTRWCSCSPSPGLLAVLRALERPTVARLLPVSLLAGLLALTPLLGAVPARCGRGPAAALAACGRGRRPRPAARSLVALAGGGVLFLPWVPTFAFQMRAHRDAVGAGRRVLVDAWYTLTGWAGGGNGAAVVLTLLLAGLAVLALLGRRGRQRPVLLTGRRRPHGAGAARRVARHRAARAGRAGMVGAGLRARYSSVALVPGLLLAALGMRALPPRGRATVLALASRRRAARRSCRS